MWRRVWIEKRRGKRDNAYRLRWYDEVNQLQSENLGPGRRHAEQRRSEKEAELNNAKDEIERIGLKAFIKEHLSLMEGQLASSTVKDQRETLEGFLEYVSDVQLDEIKPKIAEKYFARRLRKVRAATANKNLRTLRAIFNLAIRRGYLESNPISAIRPVREPKRALRILREEEIAKLLHACPDDRWRAYVFLALTTGMRRGELSALEWEDVDLEGSVLVVRNKTSHLTKSRKTRRLALAPAAVSLLERLKATSFGSHVFQTRLATAMLNNLSRDFARIVRRAGIPYCTLHDLRRTFCSYLAMNGVNEAIVQRLAGHVSIATTLNHYTDIFPDALRSAQMSLPYLGVCSVNPNSTQIPSDGGKAKTA